MKKPIKIILEGPDGSGKSTFAEKLYAKMGVKAFHAGGKPKTIEEIEGRARLCLDPTIQVHDRVFIITDWIYRHALKEPCFLDDSLRTELLVDMNAKFNVKVIYMRPPLDVMFAAWNHRAEKAHKPKEHCDKITQNYEDLVNLYDAEMERIQKDFGIRVIKFNWTKCKDWDGFLEWVCAE